MTKRQAISKAQQLADQEDRTFVVLVGDRRSFVYPITDFEQVALEATGATIVPPTGKYHMVSASQIVALELAR